MKNYKEQIKDIIRETAKQCIDWKPWKTYSLSMDSTFVFFEEKGYRFEEDHENDMINNFHYECLEEVQSEYDVELS